MQRKLKWLLVIGIVGVAAYSGSVLATPPAGVTVTPLAPVAQFGEIDAKVKTGDWKSEIRTKGLSDLHVLQVTIAPGGTFGWHSHPGPSLVIVRSGTLSVYHAPDCIPEDVGPGSPNGSTFIDQGHDLHMVRNNSTTVTADVYVVSFVPAGFSRRIDEPNPNPSICPN
jgi:hypothetical protein